ncbi:MAG TPA: hypothetical protein VGQ53_13280 [Chitinophagaceae bacterium]|nr:hypothetical protein [Chitinophagaceae bacterium]
MTRNDAEVYTETGKKERSKRLARAGSLSKKGVEVKICKHVTPGGWCNKKRQRCPLLDLLFINQ